METGLFLARAWGLYMFLMSLAFLVNPQQLTQIATLAKEKSFILIAGILSLLIGILAVLSFNVWSMSWHGLVTFMGWGALLKGFMLIAYPSFYERKIDFFLKNSAHMMWWMLLVLALGAYLTYVGFTG